MRLPVEGNLALRLVPVRWNLGATLGGRGVLETRVKVHRVGRNRWWPWWVAKLAQCSEHPNQLLSFDDGSGALHQFTASRA